MGIIDYLQAYNSTKKIERAYKRLKHPRVPVSHMSTAPCDVYQQRFEKFVLERVLIDKSGQISAKWFERFTDNFKLMCELAEV